MKKEITKFALCLSAMIFAAPFAKGQAITQVFDDIYNMPGWDTINMSNPMGTENWVQGYSTTANQAYVFTANSGAANSFISATFQNTSGAGVISNWLLSPATLLTSGDTLSFWTRSQSLLTTVYPDRLQVWHSLLNSSNVGADEFSTGDFTENLLDINPTYTTTDYPLIWTQYSLPLNFTGGSVTGRFGFRYFVEDGGPTGANSFMVAIDDVEFSPAVVGINQVSKPFISINAYPNPATDKITFNLGSSLSTNSTVTVVNESGKTVMNGVMNKGTKAQIVDISNLPTGTYIVTVIDANANFYRSHFAKL